MLESDAKKSIYLLRTAIKSSIADSYVKANSTDSKRVVLNLTIVLVLFACRL